MLSTLLDSVPNDFQLNEFKKRLILIKGVYQIHDLHIWEYHQGKLLMMVHIDLDGNVLPEKVLKKATVLCRKFGIYHSTIQIEKQMSEYKVKCLQNVHN